MPSSAGSPLQPPNVADSAPPPRALPQTMRAWVRDRWGGPEILELREVSLPTIRDEGEMVVRVLASSMNAADRHSLKLPFLFRKGQGWLRPKRPGVGLDFAGRVEFVGKNVASFHVGDEVFGVASGAYAEYAISDQIEIAKKPVRLTDEQAASMPIAAVTALQGLRDKAEVKPGQKVLINGASGGVGTFAVQIAKALGAEVDAVCSTPNTEQARALGASRVFDYTKEDFAKSGGRWDLIFDLQLNHSLAAYRRCLLPGGLLLMVGAGGGRGLFARLFSKIIGSKIAGPRSKFYIASVRTKDLVVLQEMADAGKLTPAIDRRIPFEKVPEAYRLLISGHPRAKIVITF